MQSITIVADQKFVTVCGKKKEERDQILIAVHQATYTRWVASSVLFGTLIIKPT